MKTMSFLLALAAATLFAQDRPVVLKTCRERLGGLLKYYSYAA
jgi:hypothetical protein